MLIISAIFLATFVLLAYFCGSFGLLQKVGKGNKEDFIKSATALTEKYMKIYGIPGVSVVVIDEGQAVYSQNFGYADKEEGRPLDDDTLMRTQSMTKTVTAYAVIQLVNQGNLDLDKPVYQYFSTWQFPQSKYDYKPITARNLLNHTSGLPLGDVFTIYGPKEPKPSLREKLTNECVLIYEPGKKHSYSNTGYNLLELLIEEVTGMAYADYIKQSIFEPLNMTDSTMILSDEQISKTATGYGLAGEKTPAYVFPELGSGGMFSTAADYSKFLIHAMDEWKNGMKQQIITTQDRVGIYDLVFDGYAAGLFTEDLKEVKAVTHGGQGTGIMTHFHAVPENNDAIVILTNSQKSWPYIARMVKLWTDYNGYSPSGMTRIIYGQYIMSALIGIMLALAVFVVIKAFSPTAPINLTGKILFGAAGTALIAVGLIGLIKKYSFIKAVFPFLSLFAFGAFIALGLSIVLLIALSFKH